MKKFIIIALVALLGLTACNQIGPIFNPVIGTWNSTVLGVSTTIVFNGDGSGSQTTSVLGVGVTKTGTWSSNGTTVAQSWSDGSSAVNYYTLAANNSQLTLSASPGGVSVSYSRQ